MNYYLCSLSYIGTNYKGWQRQKNGLTVQEIVEKSFATILRHPVKVLASSRTDSGVHALEQMIKFSSELLIEDYKFIRGVNALMKGRDIQVLALTQTTKEFHPVKDAQAKIYCYRFSPFVAVRPFWQPYVWHRYQKEFDLRKIKKYLQSFIGTHDFTSFCAKDSSAKTKTRNIMKIKIKKFSDGYEIYFLGKGFLKQMIRNIVGTVMDMHDGKIKLSVKKMIAAKDRRKAGRTAPAMGLTLIKVFYEKDTLLANKLFKNK